MAFTLRSSNKQVFAVTHIPCRDIIISNKQAKAINDPVKSPSERWLSLQGASREYKIMPYFVSLVRTNQYRNWPGESSAFSHLFYFNFIYKGIKQDANKRLVAKQPAVGAIEIRELCCSARDKLARSVFDAEDNERLSLRADLFLALC